MTCKHFLVRGRVQGVFFRQSARNRALELGLSGWCRNLPNGNVELQACGEERALLIFQTWLHCGPVAAVVSDVEATKVEVEALPGFEILHH